MTQHYTRRAVEWFRDHPNQPLDGLDAAKMFGAYAWRSRLSDARGHLCGSGAIVNKIVRLADGSRRSLYTFVPRGSQ